MTLNEVKSLSDEHLRIKVTELCGKLLSGAEEVLPKDATPERRKEVLSLAGVLDYPNDLNAISEAIQCCFRDGIIIGPKYVKCLEQICGTWPFDLTHATARQKAEALVLTVEVMAAAKLTGKKKMEERMRSTMEKKEMKMEKRIRSTMEIPDEVAKGTTN